MQGDSYIDMSQSNCQLKHKVKNFQNQKKNNLSNTERFNVINISFLTRDDGILEKSHIAQSI
jgi:hypothetical protein